MRAKKRTRESSTEKREEETGQDGLGKKRDWADARVLACLWHTYDARASPLSRERTKTGQEAIERNEKQRGWENATSDGRTENGPEHA